MEGQFSRKNAELYSLLAILLGSLFLAFLIAEPYLNALLAASVMAIVFQPIHLRILRFTKYRDSVAALLSILLILVILVAPVIFIGRQVFVEGGNLYNQLENRSSASIVAEVETILNDKLGRFASFDVEVLNTFIQNALKYLSEQSGSIFSSAVQFVVRIIIGILALYYFLRDGQIIRRYFTHASPLSEDRTRRMMESLELTIQSTIQGSLVVAIIQAILLGIGLFLFGVPNPFLWGSVGFIAALVPALGTTLITLPVALFLFLEGSLFQAIGFLIWGLVIVGLADNFVRPWFLGRQTGLHPFLVFISVIGGLSLFGPMGILWGPIILSVLATTIESYSSIMNDRT